MKSKEPILRIAWSRLHSFWEHHTRNTLNSRHLGVAERPAHSSLLTYAYLRSLRLSRAFTRILRGISYRTHSPAWFHSTLSSHPFDQLHGTDTSGLIEPPELHTGHRNDAFTTAYYGMAPSRFHSVLQRWIADPTHPGIEQYSFVDLGCGKGRAVLMASEYDFRQVIGVELHPSLARIARQNVALRRSSDLSLASVQILCQDASEFPLPAGSCLLYLFHPFTAPVVGKLIERLQSHLAACPAPVDIIYFNPEAGDLFNAAAGFDLLWSGTVPLSDEDAAAEPLTSPDDLCSIFRWTCSGNSRT